MDRKSFMRDVYADTWIAEREGAFKNVEYDRNLCTLLLGWLDSQGRPESQPAEMLEVAIGTGYPFAIFFHEAGHTVHGIDISPKIIDKCRELHPGIDARVGDSEALPYTNEVFDCVYCFHSTWCFTDLDRSIEEMLRVARPGAVVAFDLLNRNHEEIEATYHARLTSKKGEHCTSGVLYTVPTYPESVYERLRKSGVSDFSVLGRVEADDSIVGLDGHGAFSDYKRLVILVRK